MNRLLLGLAFVIAASGPVAAAGFRYFEQAGLTPRMVGGTVGANGTVIAGSGFTVAHPYPGWYELRFLNGSVRGCVAVTVTPYSSHFFMATATQQGACGRKVLIVIGNNGAEDVGFQFVAVEEH
jgi:hypothetical protein